MNKDKRTFFILLVGLCAVLTYFHTMVKEIIESPFADFGHYWINASLLKEGYNIWDWNKQTQERSTELSKKYNITPAETPVHSLGFFLFALPFSLFPFRLAAILWLILGHLCLFYSIWLIINLCKAKPSLEDLFMVLFLVFAFWPIKEQLHQMQPNFLLIFFMAVSLFLMQNEQMFWAGIFLGLAIQIREYLAVIVLLFLWKRNWRFLAGLILGFLLLKAMAILAFGWIKELYYWKHISTFNRQIPFSMNNHSLTAVIYRIGKDLLAIPISFGLGLLGIAFFIGKAFYLTRRKEADSLLEFSLFLVLAFLVSPWVHEQHYVVLYPAIIISWFKLGEEKNLALYGLFILAYLFLGLGYSLIRFPRFYSGLLAFFTAGKLLGVITLFFLIGRLIQKESSIRKFPEQSSISS